MVTAVVFLVSFLSGITGTLAETARVQKLEPGPWGEIEAYELVIEPPDWIVRTSSDSLAHKQETIWKFPVVRSRNAAANLLTGAGLGAESLRNFLDPARFRVTPDGTEIRPTDAMIESLSRQQRERLYPLIDPGNSLSPYVLPYCLYPEGFGAMTANSGLSPQTVDLVSELSFRRHGTIIFSDIGLVMRRASDDAERWRLHKTLRREKSLVLRLNVSESSDPAALAAYWSARGRNKDIVPLLDSVGKTSGVEQIDVVHLLPPTPRKLIHTFPVPESSLGVESVDCIWTAFNFFAHEPSNRQYDHAIPAAKLEERYERAAKPWEIGDLIVISDPTTGDWLHVCNYVAAGVVFTKNGKGFHKPWVLQPLEDVLANYLNAERIVATFFRLKPRHRA